MYLIAWLEFKMSESVFKLFEFIKVQFSKDQQLQLATLIMNNCSGLSPSITDIKPTSKPIPVEVEPEITIPSEHLNQLGQLNIEPTYVDRKKSSDLILSEEPRKVGSGNGDTPKVDSFKSKRGVSVSYVEIKSKIQTAKPKNKVKLEAFLKNHFVVSGGIQDNTLNQVIARLVSDNIIEFDSENRIKWEEEA